MSVAETVFTKPNGHGKPWMPLPGAERLERFLQAPKMRLPIAGKTAMPARLDPVRAKPAITPQVSLMIGMTAIGLGVWGTLFPKSVRRTLGIDARKNTIRTLFGARELWSGYTLAGDPTNTGALWARVGGDIFDIAVLRSLNSPENPKRGNAKFALGFVLAVTALDLITAVRMSTVQRNCE